MNMVRPEIVNKIDFYQFITSFTVSSKELFICYLKDIYNVISILI